ncbi:MAG: hypothetical protein KF723_22925 [Rhizobiaceae bacterium]|nr:hypothetical protein [Rhizobiaceae bacterium]
MANMKRSVVGYRKFEADPLLSDGLLAVQRPGGELEAAVADAMFQLAGVATDATRRFSAQAKQEAGEAGTLAARREVPGQFTDVSVIPGETLASPGRPAASSPAGGARAASEIQQPADHRTVAANILRQEEGFRPTPYWDVNAYRTGYGSDTITKADGSVVRVQQGMRVSRDEAELDLSRRIGEFEQTAAGQVGGERWNALPAHVRGALLSVTYNYGRLPGSVVKAAQGGDAGAIAGAVAGLSANRSRRQREAAVIRGGAAPAGAPASADATIGVSGGGWKPRQGNDPFTKAYNKEGARLYLANLEQEMLSTSGQLYDLYRDDPASLERGLGQLRTSMLANDVFEEIAPEFELGFRKLEDRYMAQARQRHLDRVAQQEEGEFTERTAALEQRLQQKIAGLDGSAEGADAVIGQALADIDAHYDSAVDRDLMTPAAAATAKAKARNEAASGFYLSQARGMDAEEASAYREQLRKDFVAGELPGITDIDALDGAIARQAETQQAEERQVLQQLHARRDQQVARIEAGFDVDPTEMGKLRADQARVPGGATVVEAAERKIAIARTIQRKTVPEAREYVGNLRKALGPDAPAEQIDNVLYAENRLTQLEKLAATDAVGYEVATGRLQLPAVDFAADEAGLAQQLAARRAATAPVAQKYGQKLSILRPDERELLTRMIAERPDGLPKLARALRQGLGPDAATALAEISDDAPALAHAAGVAIATGSDSFVEDVAAALSAKAQGLWKLKMPEPSKLARAGDAPALGGALAFNDGLRASVLQTAGLAFEREANMLGFDPSEVDKEGTPAAVAWNRAVNRALGGNPATGTGGLGEVNGAPIVVPAGMNPKLPQRLMSRINDGMLKQLPPIRSGNGVEITARQLRSARLLPAGDGFYRVALGDPFSFDPQFVVGADGDFWTLDLRQLEKLTAGGNFYDSMRNVLP